MGEVQFFQDLGLQGMRDSIHAEIEAMLAGKHRGHVADPKRFWRDMVDKLAALREAGAYDNAWWDDAIIADTFGMLYLTLDTPWWVGKFRCDYPGIDQYASLALNTHVSETGCKLERGYFINRPMLV